MCRVLVFSVLVCSLVVAAPARAAGPLLTQGRTLAAAQAAAPAPPRTQRKNADLYVTGLVLSGLGGAFMGYGLSLPAHTVSCFTSFGLVSCFEEGGNRVLWLGTGAAIAGAGMTLAAIGGRRVVVAPSATGGVVLRSALTF